MNIQNILSVCAFALFVIIVLIRAAVMRGKGIRTLVFGQTNKRDFLLLLLVLTIVYAVIARTFGLPISDEAIQPFWTTEIPGWFGLALCAAAITGFVLTLVSFGDSFRVGIDTNMPGELITTGMFAVSRNPIYVCFLLFFTGMFLIHRNAVIVVAIVLFAMVIHRQVLREEAFLKEHYGTEYETYRKKVKRYL